MAFKIAVQPHFWSKVPVELLGDFGDTIKGELKAKFRRPEQAEVDELVRRLGARAKTPFEVALDAGTECMSQGIKADTAFGAAQVLAITLARLDAMALPHVSAALATLLTKLQTSEALTADQVAQVVQTPATATKPLTDQEVVDKWLLNWDDVVDEHDQPLPYNATNLERMNKLLGARAAIVESFLSNYVKAPEKNSGRPRDTSTG